MANVYYNSNNPNASQFLALLGTDIVAPAEPYYGVVFLDTSGVATVGTTDTTIAIVPAMPVRYSLLGMYVSCTSLQSNTNLFVNLVLGAGTGSGAGAAGADMTAQQQMNATSLDIIAGTVGATLIRKMTAVIPGFIVPDNADTRVPAGKALAVMGHDDGTHHMAASSVVFTIVGALRA